MITYLPLEISENCSRKNWISTVHSEPSKERAYLPTPVFLD